MKILSFLFILPFLAAPAAAANVTIYPAPAGEGLSTNFTLAVEEQPVAVYEAKVAAAEPALRWKAMDDKTNSAKYFDTAAFSYFDVQGPVSVKVTATTPITSARVLPTSAKISPVVDGSSLTFRISKPQHLTVEINGNWVNSLHLFANPPEMDIPNRNDPKVLFFGPGIHQVSHVVVSNNQTVYIAGGAVVRGIIAPDEPYNISSYSGLRTYTPTFVLRGTNITFRGRGILDGSRCTTHARNMIQVQGRSIRLEGVTLRDSSTWNVPIRRSENVIVRNLKLLGYRANADGIDICNSQHVTVEDCFIRTLDDLIVVKTDKGQGETKHILARNCVLWNEVAHALSIGAELREDVDDVVFRDCDIIHDKGREWTLRVYHSDSARISNILFENLRIEESSRLISLWIDKAFWSRDAERGHIDGVLFRNITAQAQPLRVELKGYDAAHRVKRVRFENVVVNGKPLAKEDVRLNEFVEGVTFRP